MALEEYTRKRDFTKSPEPAGKVAARKGRELFFCVQKHLASHLHYDFRLEQNGVLLSWAVPKGPSLNPKDKRLAMMVEDHPLDYASFEGTIPAGGYGGGRVIVWDRGAYVPLEELDHPSTRAENEARLRDGLTTGRMSFVLRGHKLKGGWSLVKMGRGKNDWLLSKRRDEHADDSRDVLAEDRSPISGRRIEDLSPP
jgi:bifunctional non-homologous end joining protein LigD